MKTSEKGGYRDRLFGRTSRRGEHCARLRGWARVLRGTFRLPAGECSEFVRMAVLPLLGQAPGAAMMREALGVKRIRNDA